MTPRVRMPAFAPRGFTLVELMVVISILSILLGLAYPAYRAHLLRTNRAEGHAALLQVMLQQERHFMLNNRYRPFTGTSTEAEFKWFSGADERRSAYRINAVNCVPVDTQQCIRLEAVPSGFTDAVCGTLALDSLGRRQAAGVDGNDMPDVCRF